jgi:histidine triad (HIT) family protein
MDCVFCKIVAGQIPSVKVYEDGATLAFMDINPLTEGHLLVVPKQHCTGLWDAEEETLATTIRAVRRVALGLKSALGLDSLNLLQANGRWAAQSVPHLHFHLIPRREGDGAGMDWPLTPGDLDAVKALGRRVAAAVR